MEYRFVINFLGDIKSRCTMNNNECLGEKMEKSGLIMAVEFLSEQQTILISNGCVFECEEEKQRLAF